MLWRLEIRVTHAKVDDVRASSARARLKAVNLLKDIRRQALDAIKVRHARVDPVCCVKR